jgi:DNA polymerase-1
VRIVCDIEANSLVNPSHIWVIVCKDIDTGEYHIFREVTENEVSRREFLDFTSGVDLWIGHNFLEYDYPVLHNLVGLDVPEISDKCFDTLILSRLIDYSRETGHSIESYGREFGLDKIDFNDFKKYSKELETYCVRDVDICHKVYLKYLKYISNPEHKYSIVLEHRFQTLVVNSIQRNGFKFNTTKAQVILKEVTDVLLRLDTEILKAFPPRLKLVREITPKVTKHGTLSKTDFRWLSKEAGDIDLSDYNGGPFCRCIWLEFNPSSHKQIVDVLHAAGWQPSDKTATHIECERELSIAKRKRLPLDELQSKLEGLLKYGWKINETNLATLPDTAPEPARLLAKRILYESRRRTLTEWLGLVQEDGRIHGKFLGIGTWTHRTATQRPNLQNIPNEFDINGDVKFLGKDLRQLWQAPRNRLLVGVDADSIQFRVAAHYIDDPELTRKIVEGKKSDGTDPHSYNKKIIGPFCKSRGASKRTLFSLILGGRKTKIASILECSEGEATQGMENLYEEYPGLVTLRDEIVVADAKKGWFRGLDGRKVKIPGDSVSERKHLCPSGYLQNGEAVIMKLASIYWLKEIEDAIEEAKSCNAPSSLQRAIRNSEIKIVDLIHDEWQTETPNNMEVAVWVAEAQSRALRKVGEDLKLKCPLAGSYWNDDHNDYTIGTNWYQTH